MAQEFRSVTKSEAWKQRVQQEDKALLNFVKTVKNTPGSGPLRISGMQSHILPNIYTDEDLVAATLKNIPMHATSTQGFSGTQSFSGTSTIPRSPVVDRPGTGASRPGTSDMRPGTSASRPGTSSADAASKIAALEAKLREEQTNRLSMQAELQHLKSLLELSLQQRK